MTTLRGVGDFACTLAVSSGHSSSSSAILPGSESLPRALTSGSRASALGAAPQTEVVAEMPGDHAHAFPGAPPSAEDPPDCEPQPPASPWGMPQRAQLAVQDHPEELEARLFFDEVS